MASHAVGLFANPDGALGAAGRLKEAGLGQPELITPIPLHGVEEVLGPKKSAIKRFSFFGGLTGALCGFALAAGTAVLYPHPAGGRATIAFPPYLIITYEMTILFGILATVLGFFISVRLPAIRERVYVPEAAVDKFAVSLACDGPEAMAQAEAILRDAGAEEVRQVEEGQG